MRGVVALWAAWFLPRRFLGDKRLFLLCRRSLVRDFDNLATARHGVVQADDAAPRMEALAASSRVHSRSG
jgi:hypothetical protein